MNEEYNKQHQKIKDLEQQLAETEKKLNSYNLLVEKSDRISVLKNRISQLEDALLDFVYIHVSDDKIRVMNKHKDLIKEIRNKKEMSIEINNVS